MSKNIIYIASSLDGFIAKENGDIDWLEEDSSDSSYGEFIKNIDVILLGHGSYKKIQSFGIDWPYLNQISYVFTQKQYQDTDTIRFINEDISSFLQKIKANKNIWILGGSNLIAQCLDSNIVDEFILNIQPILLGKGIPLFCQNSNIKLTLLESTSYDKGSVQLHYKIIC